MYLFVIEVIFKQAFNYTDNLKNVFLVTENKILTLFWLVSAATFVCWRRSFLPYSTNHCKTLNNVNKVKDSLGKSFSPVNGPSLTPLPPPPPRCTVVSVFFPSPSPRREIVTTGASPIGGSDWLQSVARLASPNSVLGAERNPTEKGELLL